MCTEPLSPAWVDRRVWFSVAQAQVDGPSTVPTFLGIEIDTDALILGLGLWLVIIGRWVRMDVKN